MCKYVKPSDFTIIANSSKRRANHGLIGFVRRIGNIDSVKPSLCENRQRGIIPVPKACALITGTKPRIFRAPPTHSRASPPKTVLHSVRYSSQPPKLSFGGYVKFRVRFHTPGRMASLLVRVACLYHVEFFVRHRFRELAQITQVRHSVGSPE